MKTKEKEETSVGKNIEVDNALFIEEGQTAWD